MDHAIFSMARCPAIPPTNMSPWIINAKVLDCEGETISFAHTERKFTRPYTWLSTPANPIVHTTIAGICNTLISFIETSRSVYGLEPYKTSPAQAHGDFPISVPAVREREAAT